MANSGMYSVGYADILQLMISVCEIVLIVFKLWLGLTDFQNPGHGGEGCPPLITTLLVIFSHLWVAQQQDGLKTNVG